MSETEVAGWWKATDGLWYPPRPFCDCSWQLPPEPNPDWELRFHPEEPDLGGEAWRLLRRASGGISSPLLQCLWRGVRRWWPDPEMDFSAGRHRCFAAARACLLGELCRCFATAGRRLRGSSAHGRTRPAAAARKPLRLGQLPRRLDLGCASVLSLDDVRLTFEQRGDWRSVELSARPWLAG